MVGLSRDISSLAELNKLKIKDDIELLCLSQDYSNIKALIDLANVDLIIHTAAVSRMSEDIAGIRNMIDANILFSSLLFEAMSTKKIKNILNIGTSWQSINGSGYSPFNYYAATKQAAENILVHYSNNHKVNAVTLRLFDVYGESDPRGKILNLMVAHTLRGERLEMSPGHQRIYPVHVIDVCRCIECLMDDLMTNNLCGQKIFSLHGPTSYSLRQLATFIEELSGCPSPIIWGARPYRHNEIMNPCASHSLPHGYRESVDIFTGLQKLINYEKEYTAMQSVSKN